MKIPIPAKEEFIKNLTTFHIFHLTTKRGIWGIDLSVLNIEISVFIMISHIFNRKRKSLSVQNMQSLFYTYIIS